MRSIMTYAVKLVTLRGKNDFKNGILVLLRFSQKLIKKFATNSQLRFYSAEVL